MLLPGQLCGAGSLKTAVTGSDLGALGFGKLAGRLGTKNTIVLSLVIWSACVIYAAVYRRENGEEMIGPAVFYGRMHNELQLTEEAFGSLEKDKVERFHALAAGKAQSAVRGAAVFAHLQQAVLNSRSQGH